MTAKRAFDLVGASIGLLVFAIPMAIIGALVRVSLGSPVIYRQARPGLNGRVFHIYKFRINARHDRRRRQFASEPPASHACRALYPSEQSR